MIRNGRDTRDGGLSAIFRDALRRMADEGVTPSEAMQDAPFLSAMAAFALARYPEDRFLHGMVGEILFEQGDYEAALPHIRKATLRGAAGAENRARLAETLYRLERYEEALPHLKAVARRYPQDETVLMMAAYASFRQGDFAASCRFLAGMDIAEIDMRMFRVEIAAMLGAGLCRLAGPAPRP